MHSVEKSSGKSKVKPKLCQLLSSVLQMKKDNVLYELWNATEMRGIFRTIDLCNGKAFEKNVALPLPISQWLAQGHS